jgi:hypothetical protein
MICKNCGDSIRKKTNAPGLIHSKGNVRCEGRTTKAQAAITFTKFRIIDLGAHVPLRFQIDATCTDDNDTSIAATAHIASCFTRETAEMIIAALGAK